MVRKYVEVIVAYFKGLSQHVLRWTEENYEDLSQDSRSLCRNSKWDLRNTNQEW